MLMTNVNARYLDHYSYIDSPVHRLHASTKAAVAAVLLLFSLFFPLSWMTLQTLIIFFLLITALVGRVPLLRLIRHLRWVWLLILIWSLARLLYPGGWYAALSTSLWLSQSLLIVAILFSTTKFTDLLQVVSQMGVPQASVTAIDLTYRFLFALSDESQRTRRARLSRTLRPEPASKVWLWHLHPPVIAQLFVRCADRARRIHSAMAARGWQ